ncbi:hypothetical protein [Mycolicibacterium rhodesiae]|uniref:Uncharacterized protein n=1 Tax=Mycolicibacterium rhodesiae TaxID=36814 RepID=A0A1X0ILF9_MYCRH|nr:hypothetical protein [Mycolicibacterium rhodesiae]MCV7346376.1 hypothetical protein [Mycolicibacterium rhodesiae]ORB48147.1 hypothetical protein BST42_26145 [Mycolicibacterium rhodesiae]
MLTMRARFLATVVATGLVAGCGSGATTTPPAGSQAPASASATYDAYQDSYTVPWVGSPDFTNLRATLKVEASVNGGPTSPFTVDTGSVGVVVPAAEVPNIPADSPPGSLTYSSSGLELTGVWVTASVAFPQAVHATGTGATAQAAVPVLAVTSSRCRGDGVNSGRCTGAIPHMLGVGFGRGTTARAAPTHNPFLNLAAMNAGTMRRGYLIGRDGLSLGLTTANVTGAWDMQQLTSAGAPVEGPHNDWLTPTGGFQSGSGPMHSGKVLIDTGLLDMIVEADGLPSGGTVPAGTAMTVTVGDLRYSFAVGDGGPQTPTDVHRAPARNGTFVNTGLRALGHYDLLYDADGGILGLRPE